MIAAAGCDIEILGDRGSRSLGAALSEDLAGARSVSIAVAFAKQSSLRQLDLPAFCADGRDLRLVAGTDFALTELGLLSRLAGGDATAIWSPRLAPALTTRKVAPPLHRQQARCRPAGPRRRCDHPGRGEPRDRGSPSGVNYWLLRPTASPRSSQLGRSSYPVAPSRRDPRQAGSRARSPHHP